MKLFNAIALLSFNMAAASDLSRARRQLRALQEESDLDADSSMSLASDSMIAGSGAMSKSSKVFDGKSSKTACKYDLDLENLEGQVSGLQTSFSFVGKGYCQDSNRNYYDDITTLFVPDQCMAELEAYPGFSDLYLLDQNAIQCPLLVSYTYGHMPGLVGAEYQLGVLDLPGRQARTEFEPNGECRAIFEKGYEPSCFNCGTNNSGWTGVGEVDGSDDSDNVRCFKFDGYVPVPVIQQGEQFISPTTVADPGPRGKKAVTP